MDDVVAGGADHEGLAAHPCHELRPWRLSLPGLCEVGELADVMDFHIAGVLAHLASSALEPLDELGTADDRGWLAIDDDRVALPSKGDATEEGGQWFPAGALDARL